MKFIHTADLHLGCKFSSSFLPETLSFLKDNQKKVLSNIIDLANEKEVDALLIAGDLFDTRGPESDLVSFVIKEFKRANCNIFIVCGNHDPLTFESVYKKTDFPENVYIFPEEITSLSFDDYDIYGYSFVNNHKPENSLAGFKVTNENKINVMLAHGELANESFYNPIRTEDIENSGLSYLALGHIHVEGGIKKAGDTYYGYSGAPQSLTFKEMAFAKIIFAEISDGYLKTEEIPINEHSFMNVTIDITDAENDEDTLKIIKSHLSAYDLKRTLFSVVLTGRVNKDYIPDREYLKDKLSTLLYIEFETDLGVKYNIDILKEEKSVRGEFVRNALKMLEDKDEEYIEKVIEYGVNRL